MSKKLYFRYGVMNSGKSTQLLQIAHDYEVNNNKRVLVLKPKVDTKAGEYVITRMGDGVFKRKCDFLIDPKDDLFEILSDEKYKDVACVLIDESQFLSRKNVESLTLVVIKLDIPVICFGLRNDFRGHPFEGSSWLFALAQDIEEITTRALDRFDSKRATMNIRLINGKPVFEGEQISIDDKVEITYLPVSLKTFIEMKEEYYKKENKYYDS
ncbi:MAG: thymidine kinase [Thermosipho sp. (in: Bacteria)]|nr:thymidine kinase [Thermosipho sp. (in: thermotogales)]